MNRNLILVLIVLLIMVGIRITFSVEKADMIAVFLCGGSIGVILEQWYQGRLKRRAR